MSINYSKMKYCKKCLMPETRPRITFNEESVCNACVWVEEKKTLDWNARWEELKKLCAKYRSKDGNFDVLVPVSGGKDSCYVAYKLNMSLICTPLL